MAETIFSSTGTVYRVVGPSMPVCVKMPTTSIKFIVYEVRVQSAIYKTDMRTLSGDQYVYPMGDQPKFLTISGAIPLNYQGITTADLIWEFFDKYKLNVSDRVSYSITMDTAGNVYVIRTRKINFCEIIIGSHEFKGFLVDMVLVVSVFNPNFYSFSMTFQCCEDEGLIGVITTTKTNTTSFGLKNSLWGQVRANTAYSSTDSITLRSAFDNALTSMEDSGTITSNMNTNNTNELLPTVNSQISEALA